MLWPANHKMNNITVSYTATDNCAAVSCVLSVTSNQPINGTGDGDTAPDWEIVDATHVRLRAERAGNGNERIYTIAVTCTDASGNVTTKTTTVVIPHNSTAAMNGAGFKMNTSATRVSPFWDLLGKTNMMHWLIDDPLMTQQTAIEAKALASGTWQLTRSARMPASRKVKPT
jgi:hypothetical protein